MNRSRIAAPSALALALSATLALAACSGGDGTGDGTDAVGVVAEIYPLAWIAEQVGGDRVEVMTLVPAGTEVHTYEVSPQQVGELGRADLAVITGGLAAAVDDAVEASPPSLVVDAAEHITLRPAVPHSQEEEGEEADFDTHTWLDLPELPAVVDAVAAALSEIDPEGAETYAANAEDLGSRLAALDEEYRTGLSSCDDTTFIVTHPAFGYLADAYGLTQVGISGFDEDTEPSPARLAEVSGVAEESGTRTIFFPDTSNPEVADVLAGELGLAVGELSTLTGVADGDDFISAAEANLEALRTGLGCS